MELTKVDRENKKRFMSNALRRGCAQINTEILRLMSLYDIPEIIHPGRILVYKYKMTQDTALEIGINRTHFKSLVRGASSITLEDAVLLAECYNTTIAYWLDMQRIWDLKTYLKAQIGEITIVDRRIRDYRR